METKHIVAIIVFGIIVFVVGFSLTYMTTTNNNKKNTNNKENDIYNVTDNDNDNNNENEEKKEESKNENKDEYTKLNIGTATANKIFNLIHKDNSIYALRDINEYEIFTSLNSLILNKKPSVNTTDTGFLSYTKEEILEEAKIIYGEDTKLNFKNKYNTPVHYDETTKLFTVLPYGEIAKEEHMVLESIKENESEYIVTVNIVIVNYDLEDNSKVYIDTKDSYESIVNGITNEDKLKLQRKELVFAEGNEITVEDIANESKEELPKLQYKIIKDKNNKNEMYIKEIIYVK